VTKPRRTLGSTIMAGAVLAMLTAAPALAGVVESAVSQLQGQGYSNIRVTKTMLGRTKIVAIRNGATREIVMGSRSGVILRDFTVGASGSVSSGSVANSNSGSNGNSNSGNNGNGNSGNNGNGNSGNGNSGGNENGNSGGNGNGRD